jgi:hypothetical protein
MLSQDLAPRPTPVDQPAGFMPVRLLAFKPLVLSQYPDALDDEGAP